MVFHICFYSCSISEYFETKKKYSYHYAKIKMKLKNTKVMFVMLLFFM